ncbi:AAA family ATPase [Candidatus Protofrankia californiensis]|uniref:AAA family ATPase n=1 Tax=Candidatus Protofrankia californiensis TaxID=1839754 RepID=UPI001040ED20|nr:AAA family ATPase [Candidatus Protofrankia californiensis]
MNQTSSAQPPVQPFTIGPVDPPPSQSSRPVRRPLVLWDRVKFLILFAALFGFVVAAAMSDNPIMGWSDAVREQASTSWWLLALIAVEVIHQVHMFVGERSSAYYVFWTDRVFGRFERRLLRLNDWNRYRMSRTLKWVATLAIFAFVYARIRDDSVFNAVVAIPGDIWDAVPFVLQILLLMLLAVGQFVVIFWFLSRGGVDVYFPEDIKTRFIDVWGQDHVLSRVKEAVFHLEKPEEIESRGGYVPGGILLWGPPGTGKTLIAEAVAGETGKPYVFVDPGAFRAMFFGVGVMKVKSLFRKLRKLALRYGGVIVFFDEADTLGNRGQLAGGDFGRAAPSSRAGGHLFGPVDPAHSCNGMAYASHSTRRQFAEAQFVVPGGGGGQASFDGTLQALLTEISGLKKPRGFLNRIVRRALGMRPKLPPKYRIMIMMATNMPQSLDEALLRPGRIDRIYKVGYPSKEGRIRTFQGYLSKVRHDVASEQVERLAVMSPYATGASIKDMVNEALIQAIKADREVVTWQDLLKAKAIKEHGLPDDHEYVERERHSIALHEACHAVVMYRLQKHMVIDMATIERRGDTGGFVAPVPLEDRFVDWRSEVEIDVMTFLASIVGERMFFEGDHTQGVGGDLHAATELVARSIGRHAMGTMLTSRPALASGLGSNPAYSGSSPGYLGGTFVEEVEAKLQELYVRTEAILTDNRREIFAVTHALETKKTITGEDVEAIMEGTVGPTLDGRRYHEPDFLALAEEYHSSAVQAHRGQRIEQLRLPDLSSKAAAAPAAETPPVSTASAEL